MNIFRDIFLTKEEREYLKLYQKNTISFLLKKKICDFFNVENEKDWNDLLKEYCLENVFKS